LKILLVVAYFLTILYNKSPIGWLIGAFWWDWVP